MKEFDLLAILLKPEFGLMLLHGIEATLQIAAGSWLLAMAIAIVLAGMVRLTAQPIAERLGRPMCPTTATCRRWCS